MMAHPHYGPLLIMAVEKNKLACDIIKREESAQKIKTCTVQGPSCGNGAGLMSLSRFCFFMVSDTS